jgi:uncharacterized protein (DUF4415 family)
MKEKSLTDWARLDAMTDNDIDYADIPETDEAFWADAEIIIPPKKVLISIRLDADVLAWFKNKDIPYQTLINGVLRNYMKHHQGD